MCGQAAKQNSNTSNLQATIRRNSVSSVWLGGKAFPPKFAAVIDPTMFN